MFISKQQNIDFELFKVGFLETNCYSELQLMRDKKKVIWDEKGMAGSIAKELKPQDSLPSFLVPSPNKGYLYNNLAYQ